MLTDIATTIKAQLYDRLTSPLTGAFLLSWPVWNWRFMIAAFSDLKAPQKISFIENNIFTDHVTTACYGIAFPLITAILAVTLYPYASNYFYKISQSHKKQLKGIQQQIEDETPMPLQDAAELKRNFRNIQDQHDVRMHQKSLEISQAQLKIDELEKLIAESNLKSTTENREIMSSVATLRDRNESLEQEQKISLIKYEEMERKLARANNQSRYTLSILHSNEHGTSTYFPDYNETRAGFSEPRPNDIEETIEEALTKHIAINNLLESNKPRIRAVNGTIYLHLATAKPENYVLTDYTDSSYIAAIDKSKKMLSGLKKTSISLER